jgi:hypothetical protein
MKVQRRKLLHLAAGAAALPAASLAQRGNVRQRFRARCGRHCERTQLAGSDEPYRTGYGTEGNVHLSTHHIEDGPRPGRFIVGETVKWGKVIRAAGIRAE